MRAARLAADPLWQCLCPAWSSAIPSRLAIRTLSTTPQNHTLKRPSNPRAARPRFSLIEYLESRTPLTLDSDNPPTHTLPFTDTTTKPPVGPSREGTLPLHLPTATLPQLYTTLHSLSLQPDTFFQCRAVAEYLIRDRREKPNLDIYRALILSNTNHAEGAAWRAAEYLEEMIREGIVPDGRVCHAVLKVLGVHPDHLLRADVLEYMRRRWFEVSAEGWHDVVAGLWREGSYEMALEGMGRMRREGVMVDGWLEDMAVWVLCGEGEVGEAARIMRRRHEGDGVVGKSVWSALLDAASEMRHYAGTALAWNTQVSMEYINPPSGTCLNVMATAAKAGDAVLATDAFTHLSKRGEQFKPVHYESLVSCYLSARPPDIRRALSVLVIMANDKQEPTTHETRSLFKYFSRDPDSTIPRALELLRDLHSQGRNIPVAALNVLIESYVEHRQLQSAVNIYKQMHMFAPATEGKKLYANIETFNLLLRGCRKTTPPDVPLANFLVAELLTLRLKPNAITLDRLVLVFTNAATYALAKKDEIDGAADRARELTEWGYRHFCDMLPQGWTLRTGTISELALQLARLNDARCWEVLQLAEDHSEQIEGWAHKRNWIRHTTEKTWAEQQMLDDQSIRDESGVAEEPRLASIG